MPHQCLAASHFGIAMNLSPRGQVHPDPLDAPPAFLIREPLVVWLVPRGHRDRFRVSGIAIQGHRQTIWLVVTLAELEVRERISRR